VVIRPLRGDIDLIDRLSAELGGEGLTGLSRRLGEPDALVRAGVHVFAPVLLWALASWAATPQGPVEILELIHTSGFDGRSGQRTTSAVENRTRALIDRVTRGMPLVLALFGESKDRVAAWVATSSGLGTRSSLALMALSVPSALDILAHEASRRRGGLTPGALSDLLGGPSAATSAPATQTLLSAMGCTSTAEFRPASRRAGRRAGRPSRSAWWPGARRLRLLWH
jgi:hypothetical protein